MPLVEKGKLSGLQKSSNNLNFFCLSKNCSQIPCMCKHLAIKADFDTDEWFKKQAL